MKGYIRGFSAEAEVFRLFLEQDTAEREGAAVQMKDLKAIFFARDFVGKSEYGECQELSPQNHSRKAEVTFRDGESW